MRLANYKRDLGVELEIIKKYASHHPPPPPLPTFPSEKKPEVRLLPDIFLGRLGRMYTSFTS